MSINPSDELSATLTRVQPEAWDDIHVLGDVHGCAKELRALLRQLEPSSDDLVIFTGDLVRKGPASDEVVDIVRANGNYRSVQGNNEAKVIRGDVTVSELSDNQIEWLAERPNAIAIEDNLVVHGGVNPEATEQTPRGVRTVRSLADNPGYGSPPYWWQLHERPPRVFFGHTVFSEPLVTPDVVGLDTGCVYGGALTAYTLGTESITQVNAERTVQSRPDSAILDPNNVRGTNTGDDR